MPKKIGKSGTRSIAPGDALNRRALMKKIGAGIALTAAGTTLDLGLRAEEKKIHLDGDTIKLTHLSNGKVVPGDNVTLHCEKDGTVTVKCIS